MENLIPVIKKMIESNIEIKVDEQNLITSLVIHNLVQKKGILAQTDEIKIMLRNFAKLDDNIPMTIEIDNNNKTIYLKFQTRKDMDSTIERLKDLSTNIEHFLRKASKGDSIAFKDFVDF